MVTVWLLSIVYWISPDETVNLKAFVDVYKRERHNTISLKQFKFLSELSSKTCVFFSECDSSSMSLQDFSDDVKHCTDLLEVKQVSKQVIDRIKGILGIGLLWAGSRCQKESSLTEKNPAEY